MLVHYLKLKAIDLSYNQKFKMLKLNKERKVLRVVNSEIWVLNLSVLYQEGYLK